ncbi:MAG: protease inhibitor I42 family protein [Methanothrix sp.]|nr:protease inhibitor I42 family protein [Methanothrix sp.]
MANYKRFCTAILAISMLLILLPEAQAEIRVCPKDCGYSSIQDALNASLPNETITVESGTYREDVFVGKQVTMRGVDTGEGRPLLVPEKGRLILAAYGATLQGFEISGPSDTDEGNCTIEVVLPANIYQNDFAGSKSVCPDVPATWNSSYAINYQFNSQVLRSRLGNYWADYTGEDENADGIGDEPKVLDDGNIDYYPLMQPAENYRIPGEREIEMELIRARVNEPFTISLPANPTTAYEWNADYDYYLLNLTSSQFERTPTRAIGAGGTSVFVFTPLRPGKTTIYFVYKRSWENIVADTRMFHVEITV